jgi:hypothetical protein
MACLHLVGRAARRFRNDLEAARDGIEGARIVSECRGVEALDKVVGNIDSATSIW